MKKRIASILMTAVMLASLLPLGAIPALAETAAFEPAADGACMAAGSGGAGGEATRGLGFDGDIPSDENTHVCTKCGFSEAHDWTEDTAARHKCSVCGETEKHTFENGECTACGAEEPQSMGKYIERKWNVNTGKVEQTEKDIPTDAVEITSSDDPLTLAGGWYVVSEIVDIPYINVSGTEDDPTNIVLMDGCTLAVGCVEVNTDPEKGAHALNIYGQQENSGILKANGCPGCAGIGGGSGFTDGIVDAGIITIHGGTVNATGGSDGAGIGGTGGCMVRISGGTVIAIGTGGAGIVCGRGGTVEISGGTVTATGNGGAGIDGGDGSVVMISGGEVTATGSYNCAGIGGSSGRGGTVRISGGTVNATGGYNAAGIGGGGPKNGGANFDYTGGTVTATGGYGAAGIGAYADPIHEANHGDFRITDKIESLVIYAGDTAADTIVTAEKYEASRNRFVKILQCEHHYVDFVCEFCGKEEIVGAREAAKAQIDAAVGDAPSETVAVVAAIAKAGIDAAEGMDVLCQTTNAWLAYIAQLTGGTPPAPSHEHTFAEDYTYNETHHWHECTCTLDECEGLVSGFGKHSYTSISDTQHQCACGKIENHTFVNGKCVCGEMQTKCTVTFDLQNYDTEEAPTQIVEYGGKVTKPDPDPTDERRIFGGWYEDAECIHEWDFDKYTVTGDTTIYAKWIPNSCTVCFCLGDFEGGVIRMSKLAHYGQELPDITPPTREGLVFLGYYDMGEMGANSVQYYDSNGKGTRSWDKEGYEEMLIARWAAPGTIPSGDVEEEYRINNITVRESNGALLQTIPEGSFLATVSVTKLAEGGNSMVVLASYTAEGQFKGLMYVSVKDLPIGATIQVTLPVDNSKNDIAELKAFVFRSFSDLQPIGNAVTFHAASQ